MVNPKEEKPNRGDICQKIYTTGLLSQTFYQQWQISPPRPKQSRARGFGKWSKNKPAKIWKLWKAWNVKHWEQYDIENPKYRQTGHSGNQSSQTPKEGLRKQSQNQSAKGEGGGNPVPRVSNWWVEVKVWYNSKHHLGTDTECHGAHKELSLPCDQVLLSNRYRWEVVHQNRKGGQADLKKTFRKKISLHHRSAGLAIRLLTTVEPKQAKMTRAMRVTSTA